MQDYQADPSVHETHSSKCTTYLLLTDVTRQHFLKDPNFPDRLSSKSTASIFSQTGEVYWFENCLPLICRSCDSLKVKSTVHFTLSFHLQLPCLPFVPLSAIFNSYTLNPDQSQPAGDSSSITQLLWTSFPPPTASKQAGQKSIILICQYVRWFQPPAVVGSCTSFQCVLLFSLICTWLQLSVCIIEKFRHTQSNANTHKHTNTHRAWSMISP